MKYKFNNKVYIIYNVVSSQKRHTEFHNFRKYHSA